MSPDDLNVNVAENIAVKDVVANVEVGSPANPLHGFVAVLDALGAAVYSQQEADRFLDARAEITKLLKETAEDSFRVDGKDFRFFVFNDTIVVIYVKSSPTDRDVNGFFGLLRSFQVAFWARGSCFVARFPTATCIASMTPPTR
jgi:hypothetical protein